MQIVVLTFDSGLMPLLPIVLRGHPIVRVWVEGATPKHAIEALGVPYIEISQVLVDGRAMALEALLPARGYVAVPAVEPFLPAAPLHSLYGAHLGVTARLLRMAGFDTTYDNNYADAAIEALTHKEDWIALLCDRKLLKRRGIRRGALTCARELQAQIREIVTHLWPADVAKLPSRCLGYNVLLWMLSPEEASVSAPSRVHERQRLSSTRDACHRVYWPGSHWTRTNTVLADMLWSGAGTSADSAETVERMPRTGSVGA